VSKVRASVVVPAHNASATIEGCLQALARQSLPPSEYEVIVVDDGSSDSTRERVTQYGAKLLTQDHHGPAVARNLGATQARGEIVLFTDADCIPASDWIEAMLTPFKDDQIAGAKGIYRTHQKELVARFVQLEYEDKYDLMRKERYIDFIDTYSAAYRKEVFNDNGGFDPAFPRASGEDVEFSYRLAERGHKMVFVPQAIVNHYHVDSLWGYLKRKFYVGYWRVLMYRKHPGKIWKDSHTPQLLKVQVGLAFLFFTLCPLFFLRREFLLVPVITIALFLSTAPPFIVKGWPKDRSVALLSPLLLFLRACALALGLMVGLLGRLLAKEASK